MMELCGLLRIVWDHCAADSACASKVKRRAFVTAALVAAGIKHPDANDYQTLDQWIETEIRPPDPP
jgi:hypothetical protein